MSLRTEAKHNGVNIVDDNDDTTDDDPGTLPLCFSCSLNQSLQRNFPAFVLFGVVNHYSDT